ncbi:hypothetical protein V1512DRAFT_252412 [Lipomyces arxii]|uniref:uncharacterized protein n=1 Tax=Lipomyces arxii TaxID=56418 RepID=UPI0034CF9E1C
MYLPLSTYPSQNGQDLPPEVIDARDNFLAALGDWNKCMDITNCKVTAVLGIVLAITVILSVVFFIVRVMWFGATVPCRLCFWACSSSRRRERRVLLVPSNQCYVAEHMHYTDHPQASTSSQKQAPATAESTQTVRPVKGSAYPHPVPNQQAFYIDDSAVNSPRESGNPPTYDTVIKAYHD